jgi:D-alanyl-D-alanine carboxypeptidase/D-alanyl-D-alanine-endopeptidase (penicillin-binding protein 4)
MRLFYLTFLFFVATIQLSAQSIHARLASQTQRLLEDVQMKNASLSLYVADAATGELVYQYSGHRGLAPASSQKIFTAIAAFEKLGTDFRFKTTLGYKGQVESGVLKGDLIIKGYGDPTLGSWRYPGYKPEDVKNKIIGSLKAAGIRAVDGDIIVDETSFSFNPVPGGWPWNDMGNYYGAGDWGVNWMENQVNITYRGGSPGGTVKIQKVDPEMPGVALINKMVSGPSGSADKSRIFTAPYSPVALIDGRVPSGTTRMATGSMPNPPLQLGTDIARWLKENQIYITGGVKTGGALVIKGNSVPKMAKVIDTYTSPQLSRIVHYFLRKSVNLYGEAFAKAIGYQEKNEGSTETGVDEIIKFWKSNGISAGELGMMDGSGLSPQNYVSAYAEVKALLYARGRNWFADFYEALPTYNGTKMKSGTIHACKAYAGYQKSSSGKNYVFSIIINNYYGSQYSLLPKMYRILNVLK